MKKNRPRFHFIRSRLRFSEWLAVDSLRHIAQQIAAMGKDLVVLNRTKPAASFKQAQKKLGLTAAQLLQQQTRLAALCGFMLLLASITFGYAFYQLWYGSLQAVIITLVLVFILLGFAFRYHFWFIQLKEKKLGLTLQEWFNHTTQRGK